ASSRERERDRLEIGVEEEQERTVDDLLPVCRAGGDLRSVQEHAERPAGLLLPVALRHPPAVGPEPPYVGEPGAAQLGPRQERLPAKNRVLASEVDHAPDEAEQVALGALPVEPGELVVLAPRVVVAVLRSPDLVAAEKHRHALREQERREEVALLPRSYRTDGRIVGLALRSVVPRAVVVGAVVVPFSVRVVVLLVVRDEVA